MKRVVIRCLVLGGIVGLGWFGIAQAQRWRNRRAEDDRAKEVAFAKPAAVTPIPIGDDSQDSPAAATGLPGTAGRAKTSSLIDRMGAVSGDDGSQWQTSKNPFQGAGPAGRIDRQVQQAADVEPAGADDDRYPPPAARGTDRYGRGQERDPDESADDQGEEQEPSEGSRKPSAAESLMPRRTAFAEGSAEIESPEQDNFAPPANGREPQAFSDSDPNASIASEQGGDAFAPPASRAPAPLEGNGRPGSAQLEGSQMPTLSIEKIAPAEIQVGKPATFTIKVRNTGPVVAQGVEIHDEIPRGTQLINTSPRANRGPNGQLIFDLGPIKPKQEVQAQVQLLPVAEGEIGSVASVHFRADASARSIATKPELTLKVSGPAKVMIGEEVVLKIKISNPGSGAATGVVLTETVPPGLRHSSGSELEFDVGTLKPGETRDLDLVLTAAQPGPVNNVLVARAEANLEAQSQAEVEVLAPGLKVSLNGSKRRYLERNATYNVQVSNPGTAAAKDVELMAVLPKGMKFIEANNSGSYDAATRAVFWRLEELPPQETGTVALTVLPLEQGELKLQIKGKGKQGLADEHEESISVEGLAAILFELVDINDPIEVNGETTYEVRVINQGSKSASNLRVVAILPPEMKPLSAEGPVNHVVDGQRVLFDPLAQLAPKADTTYTIKAQGLKAGDMRIRVQIVSDELSAPITKEESTRIFADE